MTDSYIMQMNDKLKVSFPVW